VSDPMSAKLSRRGAEIIAGDNWGAVHTGSDTNISLPGAAPQNNRV
jgi:hypothetical protein